MDGTFKHTNWPSVVTANISCGAQLQDITRELSLLSEEFVEELDCAIVVCMLSAPPNHKMLTFAEMADIGSHVNALCAELSRHRRAAIIIGGAADVWKFPSEWDHMVAKCVTMCRAHGFPTIDGSHYFRRLEIQEWGFHFVKTEKNREQAMVMLEETRNMLYAVWPHGCFARLIALPASEAELIVATPTQVGSRPSPTQVGMAAGSSTDVVLPPFPAPTPTYADAVMAGKVGWHSSAVVCPRLELWPP